MERTRVILAGMPRILREIVEGLVADEHELEIVEEDDVVVALTTIENGRDSVVITTREGLDRESVDRLLSDSARVRLLVLSGDGRNAARYDLRVDERAFGEMSQPVLLAAIRGDRTPAIARERG